MARLLLLANWAQVLISTATICIICRCRLSPIVGEAEDEGALVGKILALVVAGRLAGLVVVCVGLRVSVRLARLCRGLMVRLLVGLFQIMIIMISAGLMIGSRLLLLLLLVVLVRGLFGVAAHLGHYLAQIALQ